MDTVGQVKVRSRANASSFKRAALTTALLASTVPRGAGLSTVSKTGWINRRFEDHAISFPTLGQDQVLWGDIVKKRNGAVSSPPSSLPPYVINYMPQHVFLKTLTLKIVFQQPLSNQ